MKKVLIFGGIAIVLGAIAYFGYKAYKAKQTPGLTAVKPPLATPTATSNGKPVVVVPAQTSTTITQSTAQARG
jgi:hypothetical protein